MADKNFKVKSGISIQGATSESTITVANAGGILIDGSPLSAGVPKGNTASRPASPEIGDIYSNTQTGYIEVYTAAGWSQLGVIPSSATIGTATDVGTSRAYNNGAASVTFTAGSGGGLVSSYTAISTTGGYSATGSSSPIVVPGIPSNTSLTFTVTATNGYGNSLASAASNSATITTVPQAPTIGTPTNVTGRAFGATTSSSVPVTANATGGKAVSGFTVTSSPGSLSATGTSPVVVTGLTSGTSYTFTAVANNDNGSSTASTASTSLTPSTVPQAPVVGTATQTGNTTATLTFSAPASNGNSTITSYTATSSPGGITSTLNQAGSGTFTITGLSPSTAYTFTITATNANGTSLPSAASNSITTTYVYALAQTYNSSTTYTVPSGVNRVAVWAFGPGSAGGGGSNAFAGNGGGGGAGGGLVGFKDYAVNSGQQFAVSVGSSGGTSSFGNLATMANSGSSNVAGHVLQSGGGGGGQGNSNGGGYDKTPPNAGGTINTNLNLSVSGIPDYGASGGGGGGAAGAYFYGATGGAAGGTPRGGAGGASARGGNEGYAASPGTAGTAPGGGGGGGGGGSQSQYAAASGGAGGQGQVLVYEFR